MSSTTTPNPPPALPQREHPQGYTPRPISQATPSTDAIPRRKPVASTATTPAPVESDATAETANGALPETKAEVNNNGAGTAGAGATAGFGAMVASRWSRLTDKIPFYGRKRKIFWIASGTGLLLLLALIIGLSVGLTVHKGSSIDASATTTGKTHSGDLTYFDPGLGACGITSSSTSHIVAISHSLFDASSTSSNPNANPLCNRKIRISYGSKKMDVTVVDRCVGCEEWDLDTTSTVFEYLVGDLDVGRTTASWVWLES